jgi:hypothetical protein
MPSRVNRRLPSLLFGFISLAGFLSVAFSACAQQPSFAKLQGAYEAEANPVKRAKLLAKLGPLAVDEASKNLQNDRDEPAFTILERFRDDTLKTADALFAAQPNAIRHPAGFKELQIGLRRTLRRLNDLSSEVPIEKEDELAALRMDLTTTQNSLIDALFPPSKDKRPKDGKAD